MNPEFIAQLKSLTLDDEVFKHPKISDAFNLLLNAVENLAAENQQLKKDIQKLKDENNRLKGEQGKPDIRAQKKDGNISSEKERQSKKTSTVKKSKKKKNKIKIDQVKICAVDRSTLPHDAVFKCTESVVVQDIAINTHNIEFKKEVFYSPSLGKNITGQLPPGYHGEFGPGIKALVIVLSRDANLSEPAILRLLTSCEVLISSATISRILTNEQSVFHQEKIDIFNAGLKSTHYQHIDDTGGRVNGKNQYVHILCNPYYTAYFTYPKKNRLTILEILSGGELLFCLNPSAIELMAVLGLSKKQLDRLKPLLTDHLMNRKDIDKLIATLFPNPKKNRSHRRIILEACAITAYQNRPDAVQLLIADDAPQFKNITSLLSLCWVHEGRHYKKIKPFLAESQQKVDDFLTVFWDYYHQLLDYKENPCSHDANTLSDRFDEIFSEKTGYDLLDERIHKTRAKKEHLLLVLYHPSIDLHNNSAELGARVQTRYRDVSLQTKNEKGTQAKDTMMTIVQTAKKLKVNVFHYIKDRISEIFQMPSLADLILERSQSVLDTT